MWQFGHFHSGTAVPQYHWLYSLFLGNGMVYFPSCFWGWSPTLNGWVRVFNFGSSGCLRHLVFNLGFAINLSNVLFNCKSAKWCVSGTLLVCLLHYPRYDLLLEVVADLQGQHLQVHLLCCRCDCLWYYCPYPLVAMLTFSPAINHQVAVLKW